MKYSPLKRTGSAGVEQPGPPDAAVRAVHALRAFGPELKRLMERRLPAGSDLTAARLQALAVLAGQGPLTMVALSRQLGTTAHNVTKLVDALEADGLVERRRDANDRRAVTLHVTAKGRQAERQLAHAHTQAVAEAFTDLTEEELEQLVALLERLREGIARRLG